uniref:Uncharacterized protein n=1 Tax=Anguilla anguilla TaxID=7936 RepID=A0A0E9XX00_ANGAN
MTLTVTLTEITYNAIY